MPVSYAWCLPRAFGLSSLAGSLLCMMFVEKAGTDLPPAASIQLSEPFLVSSCLKALAAFWTLLPSWFAS